jgi:hypothetical protein
VNSTGLAMRATIFPASMLSQSARWKAVSQAFPAPNCVMIARQGCRRDRRIAYQVAAAFAEEGTGTVIVEMPGPFIERIDLAPRSERSNRDPK